jgi:protein disulfide-isomerase
MKKLGVLAIAGGLAVLAALLLSREWTSAETAKAEWLTDLSEAQSRARAENKLVLLDFTGSGWCAGCQFQEKKLWSAPEFTAYARSNLVLVKLDFPEWAKPGDSQLKTNLALSEKFKVEGFPTIIILNADGQEIKREEGYDGTSAKKYVDHLKKLKSG